MFIHVLKSKIHRAKVTSANLNYEGSITIDKKLMEAADILPHEQVHVLNINNGTRAITYAIEGEPDSGIICCNGALARLAEEGDLVIILAYTMIDENEAKFFKPTIIHVDELNRVLK